jgi:hypothetical protein
MPRVSAAFFFTAALCLLVGMLWGIRMGASQDMTTMPAHAHLNLLGWVTLSIYGAFYALARSGFSQRLAWANYVISTLGVVILIPTLALFLSHGNDPAYIPVLGVGEVLSVVGLLVFAVSAVRELKRAKA